jgi:Lon protease-like protein
MPTLEVPLFPLGVVLFPGTPQLLHIFEPRYRQLLADCLGGDRRFGLSYVASGDKDDPAPEPGDVGCLAIVHESRLLSDGRSNILAVGEVRYVLQGYPKTDLPYRVAKIETFDDHDIGAPQAEELATQARGQFAKFIADMQTLSDRPHESMQLESAPQALSFQIAAALELEPHVKQELLVLRSTNERLRRLLRLLRPLNDELARRAAVHRRARGNGKGGATRDVVTGGE